MPQRRDLGFTLIELLVVMGILSGFLVLLVQLVDTGLRLFQEGELGQLTADRSSRAQRLLAGELAQLRGSGTGRDRDGVDDRLLVQWLPIGLPAQPEPGPTRVQVLRAAVHLPRDREVPLRDVWLAARALAAAPGLTPSELDAQVAAAREHEPLRGFGNLLLLPWRQEGADGALLELRAGWFLPGQLVPVGNDRLVDPFEVPVPGTPDLPGLVVHALTTPILTDLLHVELLFWSQQTAAWGTAPAADLRSGGRTPEGLWDSARGGWLVDVASGGAFALDRGPASLRDPTDDIHPHAVLVRCVVAQPPDAAPEGLLAEDLVAGDTSLLLVNGDRFPGPVDGGWVKVGPEWMRYARRDGDVLRNLQRGQRATKAREHAVGTRVHHGRTVEFVVPVPHARDDWNG
ncbi:MAG: type II secretion system protein [Planctomycetes bacterium]|nr:type II secretion system protein [Planctomycetota bacterium]